MIDQIAEALMRFDGIDPNGPAGIPMVYRHRADAVLQAMETTRETEAMLRAATVVMGDCFVAHQAWAAMIRAARQG